MAEAPVLETVSFKEGSCVFVEGQHADCFYIIRSGKVFLSKTQPAPGEELGELCNPGDCIGVVSAMSYRAHIETAFAKTDVNLIKIQRNQYSAVAQNNFSIALKIITLFSAQTRFLNDAFTKTVWISEPPQDEAVLFNNAKFYENMCEEAKACYLYHRYIERFPSGEFAPEARDRLDVLARFDNPAPPPVVKANRTYPKDSFIFAEGEGGDVLFVLLQGQVQITKVARDKEIIIAVLRPGDIFGEMALLESMPRSANAIAVTDCAVMIMGMHSLKTSVKQNPAIIEKLTSMLAERIWFRYKQLANVCIKDPVQRLFNALAIHLEKEGISGGHRFILDFGPDELAKQTGLSGKVKSKAIEEAFSNDSLSVLDGKIVIHNASVIEKLGVVSSRHK